jgi:peptide/nickel transport system substrate-binding protein
MSFFKNLFFAFTKKERVLFIICLAAAIGSFIVVMSSVLDSATSAIPTAGGSYRVGVIGQPEYVNPVTAQSETDLSLVKLLYANLPDLADNITSSTDGRTWTVHLKSGLTWQDGQKITSDDVIFTVQSIQDQDANSPLYASWQGVTANRVSELELTFTLATPYAFFGDNLANLYIIPKHIFADVPPGNWHLSDYNLKPVGSGPYEFSSYDEQSDGFISSYRLTSWNGYVASLSDANASGSIAAAAPLIQNLNFEFFPNEAALMDGFNGGAIDGFGSASIADTNLIKRPYNSFAWPTTGYYAIFWNESKNLALQDPAVRQALSLAIDRNALVSQTLADNGSPDFGPVPPDARYAISPTPANASSSPASILDNAGWTLSSSTSFRVKTIQKTSVPLAITLTVPNIDFLVATAQSLQATWQSIGVQVTVATDTPENIINTTIKNRAYEALLFGNVLGPSSDLYSFWDSSQRFSPGLNLAIYSNPKVDTLIETARDNPSDASRTAEFATAQNDIVADNPAVFLYSPDYLFISSKNLQGVSPSLLADPSDLSRAMTEWYLNTTRVLK